MHVFKNIEYGCQLHMYLFCKMSRVINYLKYHKKGLLSDHCSMLKYQSKVLLETSSHESFKIQLCFLFRIMKCLFLAVALCLLVQCCIGCSIWNQGKPCKCSCEDTSASCRQTCYLMCYGGKCRGRMDIILQTRCYNATMNTFSTCYNSCP